MPSGGPTSHILPEERETASFHIQGLKEIVSGTKRQQAVQDFKYLFDENPIFESGMDDFLSYPELAEKQIIRAGEAIRTVRENPKFMAAHMAQQVSMADMFDTGGLGIHFVAYLPFLESQANEEQLAKWRPGARMFSYMGAYAQTELGHGSNVRGLETTATFDKDKDEFVINSPTLTSMKWCAETTSSNVCPEPVLANGSVFTRELQNETGPCFLRLQVADWDVRRDPRRRLRPAHHRWDASRRVWILHAVP
jgi:hypothetical protein